MSFVSPIERRTRRKRSLYALAFVFVGLIVCLLLDRVVFAAAVPAVEIDGAVVVDKDAVEGDDWYSMFRSVGYAPLWLLIGAVFVLTDLGRAERESWKRGVFVFVSALLAGLVAELAKLIVSRERPISGDLYTGGVQHFPFAGFGGLGNLGFPSSHTAVAFGGAAAAALVFRPSAPVLYLAAAGCAYTRIVSGAHWLSDTFGGAAIGIGVALVIGERVGLRTRSGRFG